MDDEQVARGLDVASGGEADLGQLIQRFGDVPGAPLYGVVAPSGSRAELLAAVTVSELRRRCGSSNVRPFAPTTDAAEVLGEVAVPLYSSADELSPLGRRLAAVVTLAVGTEPAGGPVEYAVGDDDGNASPLALAWRVCPADVIDSRIEYLRVAGLVPATGPFVLTEVTGSDADSIREVVTTLSTKRGQAVVEMDRFPSGVDLLAAVASADLVVTDSPAVLTLAVTGRRPALGVAFELDGIWAPFEESVPALVVIGKAELAERLQWPDGPLPDPDAAGRLVRSAELFFDDLSSDLLAAEPGRLTETMSQRIDELLADREALRTVNQALRHRLDRERSAMANYVRAMGARLPSTPTPLAGAKAARQSTDEAGTLEAVRHQVDQLQGEIDRIYATRAMRLLAPARRVYARLRSIAS